MESRMSKKWSEYFMTIAKESSNLSKDPNTKVGCVIVKNKKILSIGYNGAPRGFDDSLVPRENSTNLIESKNSFMVHAETNAILNYDGDIRYFEGSTVFVTSAPCVDCAKMLAQIGVKEVVYLKKYREELFEVSKYILNQCGIELISFDDYIG